MRLQVQVTASLLNIRSGAGASFKITGTLAKNTTVNVNSKSGSWYKLENGKGWISSSYVKTIKNLEANSSSTTNKTDTSSNVSTSVAGSTAASKGFDSQIINQLYTAVQTNSKKLNGTTRLFGAPHQFTHFTDFRLSKDDETSLGRKYMEALVAEAPIVYFMPGKPNYLPDLSTSERESLTNFFANRSTHQDNRGALQKILKGTDTRYFGFLADYSTYIRYVNMMCRIASIYMGIGDMYGPVVQNKYRNYNWGNYRYEATYKSQRSTKNSVWDMSELKTDMYEALFGSYQYSQFFADPSISFSETNNNNTSQSKVASIFETSEGLVKELSFLSSTMAIKSTGVIQETLADGMADISEKMQKNNNENFFTRLLGMSSQVLTGSNIAFPEIWGDSSYNKSYNITINLVSPYGNKESIYLNIIVPLMHLLALALPRQTSANSFGSPFLVKAFAKGWFSCEMGVIDSISINKGGTGMWSINGLPTKLEVTLSIKDLYNNLSITPNSEPALFFENQGMIEFLAVTCGVDLSKPNFATRLDAIFATIFNTVADIPENLARDIIQRMRQSVEGLWRL